MNIAEIEKIKGLVNTSPILSLAERAEWLALLEVMNDKQLGELERILAGSQQSAIKTITFPLNQSSNSGSGQASPLPSGEGIKQGLPSLGKPRDDLRQMPKLSHIMNLPKLGDFNQASKMAPAVPPPPAQKKPSIFASRLKAIFQEKELPPGYAELELTQGEADKSQKSKVESGKGETEKNQGQKVQAVAPKPFFPVKENPLVSPQIVKPLPPKVPIPPKPKIVSSTATDLPALKPLKITAPSPEATQQISSKPDLPDLPDSRQINDLQDLAMFEPKTLQETSLDALAKKIKSLVGKYGYFEVIFNIEKSRAYKSYIGTGLKLLSDRSSFENLGGGGKGEYLSKEQFEKFADLLAKIQTS